MTFNTIDDVKIIELNTINSKNASLFVFENTDNYFEIKRIFTVKRDNEEEIRMEENTGFKE